MPILKALLHSPERPTPLMFAAAILVIPNGRAPGMGPVKWETHIDDLDEFRLACWTLDGVLVMLQRYRCEDQDRYTLRIAAQDLRDVKPSQVVHAILEQWVLPPSCVEWRNHGLDRTFGGVASEIDASQASVPIESFAA